MQAFIGVDIGTTNTKAVVLNRKGEVVASEHIGYKILSPEKGYQELDPETLLNAVIYVLKKIIRNSPNKSEICGVGFSCAMHSLIAVDINDKPLTQAITWADLRSDDEALKLKKASVGNRIYELTGTPIHAMSPLCKILWLKNHNPDVFSKAKKFIGIKEYIWYKFFGNYQIDYSMASATGLFNIYEFRWSPESLEYTGIHAGLLSEPVDPTYSRSDLTNKYLRELDLSAELPFVIGGSDGCLANLGSNAIREGDTSLTIGTSGALRMASRFPRHDPKQRIFNYVLTENLYISGGAMNNGGAVVQWYINNFYPSSADKEKNLDGLMSAIGEVKAGSDGLIFLPYLFGERAPVWNANAKAVFFGIQPSHQQKHFLRAVIEGISFSIFQIGVSLEETIGPINRIIASGGFIQSKAWLQMIADVFNKEVQVLENADASAIGAAILGLKTVGLIQDFDEITNTFRFKEKFKPDDKQNLLYQASMARFSSLYKVLKDEFEK